MELTAEQLAARATGIGGSDAARIMEGDWLALYEEKLGLRQPENLEWVLPVQMGKVTEELNRRFTEHKIGVPIEGRQPTHRHPLETFMLCNLDGFVPEWDAIAEFKHVNAWLEKDGVVGQVERYYPQLQHNMRVRGVRLAVFGVFFGNTGHEWIKVEYDREYAAELVRRERLFWSHVENVTPPKGAMGGAKIPKPKIDTSAMKRVSMWASNSFADAAGRWGEDYAAAQRFKQATEELKKLMPEDAVCAYGHGVQVSRSTTNALTVSAYKAKKGDQVAALNAAE
jgi:predicted phage-related endonuclease